MHPVQPPFAEGMTIPHYRPIRPGGNPFALAIWLGVWTPGGNLKRGYRICVGRLWIKVDAGIGQPHLARPE